MRTNYILLLLFTLSVNFMFSQDVKPLDETRIKINWDKTTHLIFPTEIKYHNSVNDFIVCDNPARAKNILSIKANSASFEKSSNLSIATADGLFYAFNVSYTNELTKSNYSLPSLESISDIPIAVNTRNNTHVLFGNEVVYIDFGNGEFINVEPAENLQNVIRITALKNFETPTNVSIYTKGKDFFSFHVTFDDNINTYTHQIGDAPKTMVLLNEDNLTDAKKKNIIDKTLQRSRTINSIGVMKNKIEFSIHNILIDNNRLIFKIAIKNKSNIKYDIDYIKFNIIDKKITKQTASQRIEVNYLFIDNPTEIIEGKKTEYFIVAFDKFTIPDNKSLLIEINEKDQGRYINYKLGNDDIINAENL